MPYKTIVLEIIQEMPELFAKLKANNSLISTTDSLAAQLRENHLLILEQLHVKYPDSSSLQLKSEAMEIALNQFMESMQGGSHLTDPLPLE